MSNERDELALELFIGDNFNQSREASIADWEYFRNEGNFQGRIEHYEVMADAILAAGYRKPRVVATVEELNALPDAVLILTEQGGYWESIKRMDRKNWWHEPGSTNVSPSEDLTLPATVLHEGVTK